MIPKTGRISSRSDTEKTQSKLKQEIEELQRKLEQLQQERAELYDRGKKSGFLPGELTGKGLGYGTQGNLNFLPERHTDFIFSVVGEELGLLGTGLLLVAFSLLFWRGMRAALRAPDRFGFYLALGATSLLTLQGLIHMAVCLGLFPTKGLPMPFISYGGSSLVASMAATGLLLNVSQHSS